MTHHRTHVGSLTHTGRTFALLLMVGLLVIAAMGVMVHA